MFFDYRLNGIGANGSVYSVKCIDINSNRSIENIRKDIVELESLHDRLNTFSKNIVTHPDENKHYLVIDPYKGEDDNYAELYDTLVQQAFGTYEVKGSDVLSSIVALLKEKEVTKFSELIR